jgi:SAM-dependent methyltransferase
VVKIKRRKVDKYISRDTNRNNRLYPSRTNPRYYIIIQMRKRIEWIIEKYLKNKHSNSTLVDFGCGIKPYYNLFFPYVSKYLGADIEGNPDADIIISQNNVIPLDNNSIEIVLSNQVLEHVNSPDLYLGECFRILKNDGLLIISTHGYWMYHPDPNDYWRWTSSGLKKIITSQGFTIDECVGVMGLSATSMHLFQDSIHFKLHSILRKPFIIVMQFIIRLMDKIQKQSEKDIDSSVYFIIAKKGIEL